METASGECQSAIFEEIPSNICGFRTRLWSWCRRKRRSPNGRNGVVAEGAADAGGAVDEAVSGRRGAVAEEEGEAVGVDAVVAEATHRLRRAL